MLDFNKIRFFGRHITKDNKPYFSYSGTGFEFNVVPEAKYVTVNISLLSELREIISMKVVYNMVSRALKKNYSSKMIRLICKMIELDERERFSFGDIEKYIKENY